MLGPTDAPTPWRSGSPACTAFVCGPHFRPPCLRACFCACLCNDLFFIAHSILKQSSTAASTNLAGLYCVEGMRVLVFVQAFLARRKPGTSPMDAGPFPRHKDIPGTRESDSGAGKLSFKSEKRHSFVTERFDRIHTHRPACRKITSCEGDACKQNGNNRKRQQIGGRDAVEHVADEPRES